MNHYRIIAVLLVAVASLLVSLEAANATPIVVPTVTVGAAGFHYDYSITNDLSEDLILVDIFVLPGDVTLTNLFAPGGFSGFYDSGLGIVSFFSALNGGLTIGAGSTLSGFGFDSAHAPGASFFDVFTDLTFTQYVGSTQAPVGAVVPEADTLTLLSLGLGVFFVLKRTRKLRHSN